MPTLSKVKTLQSILTKSSTNYFYFAYLQNILWLLRPCHTVTIYTANANEFIKVKKSHYSSGHSCDNSTEGAFVRI